MAVLAISPQPPAEKRGARPSPNELLTNKTQLKNQGPLLPPTCTSRRQARRIAIEFPACRPDFVLQYASVISRTCKAPAPPLSDAGESASPDPGAICVARARRR